MLANAADTLFLNHQFFTYAIPVPIFDVSSALSIRSRGFLPLPGCIGQIDSVPKPPSGRRRALLEVEANALVYTLLHQSQWPLGLRLIEVCDHMKSSLCCFEPVKHKIYRKHVTEAL